MISPAENPARSRWRRWLAALALGALALALAFGASGCNRSRVVQAGYTAQEDLSALGTDQPVPKPYVKMPVAGKVEPPPSGAYLGVYTPPAPWNIESLTSFETTSGRAVSIVMWYQPWSAANRWRFDAAACVDVMRRGAVPMITWEPWDPSSNANNLQDPSAQPDFALREINSGRYDTYIKSWADQIRDLGGPIMLRPMHEMNGNWYPWGGTANGNKPEEYVVAWRRIHDIFEREGATNVTWVWSINRESVPASASNSFAAYYPGDQYVDWTAISGFNWGTALPTTQWRPYSFLYQAPLAYLQTLGKPICIAEFASVEQGGNKAAWVADAYSRIPQTPQVKAVIYFDSLEAGLVNAQDWRIGTSAASVAAFRQAVASPYFVGGPPMVLTSWAQSLGPSQWRYLSTIERIY